MSIVAYITEKSNYPPSGVGGSITHRRYIWGENYSSAGRVESEREADSHGTTRQPAPTSPATQHPRNQGPLLAAFPVVNAIAKHRRAYGFQSRTGKACQRQALSEAKQSPAPIPSRCTPRICIFDRSRLQKGPFFAVFHAHFDRCFVHRAAGRVGA